MKVFEELTTIKEDLHTSLTATPRRVPSKYFYDEEGSRIFREIMDMPGYYLTHSEYEIFKQKRAKMADIIAGGQKRCNIVEFGAGDGLKTKLLLEQLIESDVRLKYVPVDISEEALSGLITEVESRFPGIDVQGMALDYFEALAGLNTTQANERKVILFLGSTIGNLDDQETGEFLQRIHALMNKEDLLLIGFDLKKDPELILKAYNDAEGITRRFNLNLLVRLNRELDGDFDTSRFRHHAAYDPVYGMAASYLVSTCRQQVHLRAIDLEFVLQPWEAIHTEISRKYDEQGILDMADRHGYEVVDLLYDNKEYFTNSIWKKKG